MAEWASYKVDKPIRKPHIRDVDGKRFKWWITVHFFDDKGMEYETNTYHYTTNEEVLADIRAGKEINLNRCYVKGLSLGWKWGEDKIPVNLHYAVGAFFDDGLDFGGVQFEEGLVNFKDSLFCFGDVSFENSVLENIGMSFIRAKFIDVKLYLSDAILFSAEVSFFMSFFSKGYIRLAKLQMQDSTFDFHGLTVDTIDFISTTISGDLKFQSIRINYISFRYCCFNHDIVFGSAEVKRIQMLQCRNHAIIEINWKENNLAKAIKANVKKFYSSDQHHRASETALLLKENFRKLGRYEDEDEAYYMYKKHRIRSEFWGRVTGKWYKYFNHVWALPWFLLQLLLLERLCGYGVKPLRAIISTMVTWLGFTGFYYYRLAHCGESFGGQSVQKMSHLWQAAYHSIITFLTIGYGDIYPDSNALRIASGLEGYMGLFLMAVFTVTFMRKILR